METSFYFHYIVDTPIRLASTVLFDVRYTKLFILSPETERIKVHIRHFTFWEFKQSNNFKAIDEKIFNVYAEGIITNRAVRN